MTINQLIKRLEKLRDEHGKTVPVGIDMAAFTTFPGMSHTVVDVSLVLFERLPVADGDGYTKVTKKGTEATQRCIVLR